MMTVSNHVYISNKISYSTVNIGDTHFQYIIFVIGKLTEKTNEIEKQYVSRSRQKYGLILSLEHLIFKKE